MKRNGTDVEDEVRSKGHEELVVLGGSHRRNFVSGELSKLDGILSNRRAPSIDEDPGALFRSGTGAGLDQVQGQGAVKGLESRVQPVRTGSNSVERCRHSQEENTYGTPVVTASSKENVPSGIFHTRSENAFAYSENAPRSVDVSAMTSEDTSATSGHERRYTQLTPCDRS